MKYHVASGLLVSRDYLTIPNLFHRMSAFLKGNSHISHLLMNGKFPKVSPRSFINIQGFFDRLGNSYSKIVAFLPIFCLDLVNDSISPTQYIINPPLERRLFLLLVRHCVFRNLHGIGMLQINQGLPFGGSALPLYLQITTSCCLLCVHVA